MFKTPIKNSDIAPISLAKNEPVNNPIGVNTIVKIQKHNVTNFNNFIDSSYYNQFANLPIAQAVTKTLAIAQDTINQYGIVTT